MRVFVAGATGVIGRFLVPKLLGAGHDVTGMTRSQERARALEATGAQAVVCDVFDAAAVREAVVAARPEVVVHQLTDIPQEVNVRRWFEEFAGNDRIRVEGTRNLVDGAVAAGARRVVAQSIAFLYEFDGDGLKREDDPLMAPPNRSADALRALEGAVTQTAGLEGVVLRYGYLYGPGTGYATDGQMGKLARKRRLPIVGRGTGVYSMVHVEDAADAAALALDSPATGVFNVVDDDPAPTGELVPAFAHAIGAPRPRRLPAWLVRRFAGPAIVQMQTQTRGASNERAKRELHWTPAHPSWRQGFATL